MSITSLGFVLFFIIIIIAYYLFPFKYRWFCLLLASLVYFYLSCGWKVVPTLLFGVLVTYFGALLIQGCKNDKGRKIITVITVTLALSELLYLKCFVNIGQLFGALFSVDISWDIGILIAPIGISYYMLSIVGYVIDVYRGIVNAQSNVLKHALFTTYFPQLISGPVVRYNSLAPQLFEGNKFDYTNLADGLQRMLWGYFKKLVVADRIATVVATVYGNSVTYSGVSIAVATICYAFQLYADFSGCMDIIMGVSECFGIFLPENFDAPYFSRTIAEFWRRWHITLGLWFKDYLMYPLLKSNCMQSIGRWSRRVFGKKTGKKIPTYIVLVIVWLCLGIWHGATPKYIMASGVFPCIFLISSEVFQPLFVKINSLLHIKTESAGHRFFGCVRTFILMCICFTFARAEGLQHAFSLLKSLLQVFNLKNLQFLQIFDGTIFNLGLNTQDMFICFIGVLVILFADYLKFKGIAPRQWLHEQSFVFHLTVLWISAFSVLAFGVFGQSQFIYFQF